MNDTSNRSADGGPPLPLVTVIMPVRNEGAYIDASLAAVLAQDYPPDRIEILVADGRSTDGTAEVVRRLQDRHPNLRLIDNPGRIVPTGMNLALREARGDILVRVDGHCEVRPDYVRRCVEHLQRDAVDGVGGPIETIGETPLARIIALGMSARFGVGGSTFRTVSDRTMPADTIPFPAYRRAAVERAGLYDEELVRNQDDEYNYRLRGLGGKLLLAADVRSRYYSRSSLRSLWRQYFQYGYWKVRVMQKHPRQMRRRQFVPALFVAALLTGAALSPVLSLARWGLLIAVGLYASAALVAAARTARGHGTRAFALLPVVFAILHLSYGTGFLWGLLRFWNRWGDRRTRELSPNPSLAVSQMR